MPDSLYDLAPSSPASPGGRSFLAWIKKGTKKNLAPIEKRRWKATARFLCTPFFKGAGSTDQRLEPVS
jgi:hypothetical protein